MGELGRGDSFAYNPALDGLRAIAIFGVFVFHTAAWTLPGGFVGVDVFFVLSGYLITSIIVHDLRGGGFSMREFYLRRVQRLMPNAVLMIAATIVLSRILLPPTEAWKAARHGLFALFSLSNVFIERVAGGYWGAKAASYPLLHTWSLGAEEQFYILFPTALLLLALWWRGRRRTLALVALAAVMSLALAVLAVNAGQATAAFYLLPMRVWQLLLGALLALWRVSTDPADAPRTFRRTGRLEIAGWLGICLIMLSFVRMTGTSQYHGLVSLAPTVGALLVLMSVADGETRLAQLLSLKPLSATGKVSYSLYLWHWPLIFIGATYAELTGQRILLGALAGAAVSIVVSIAAHRWVETPARRRGPNRRRRVFAIGIGFAACLGLCLAFLAAGRPIADPDHLFDPVVFRGLAYDSRLTQTHWDAQMKQKVTGADSALTELASAITDLSHTGISDSYSDLSIPSVRLPARDAWKSGGIIHRWGGGTPRVVVIGSSHAMMYGGVIDDLARELRVTVAFLSADAISVFPCRDQYVGYGFYDTRDSWIKRWRPDVLVMVDAWAHKTGLRSRLGDLMRRNAPYVDTVVLVSQVPVLSTGQNNNLREYVTWYMQRHHALPRIEPNDEEETRRGDTEDLISIAGRDPKIRLIRADAHFLLPDGSVRYSSGRMFYYADDDHLSEAGAVLLRSEFAQAFKTALQDRKRLDH